MSTIEKIEGSLEETNSKKKKIKRNKHQREADRKKISDLYLEGESQYAIAQKLNLSQSQVSVELSLVRKQWVEETNIQIDEVKAEKLKELEWAKQEFRKAWEKSKRIKKVSTKRGRFGSAVAAGVTGSPTPTTFELLEEEELGDKKYMDGFLQCISEELKITGGYAPKKIAETDPTGKHEAGQFAREEALRLLEDIASKIEKPKELPPAPDYIDVAEDEHLEEVEDQESEVKVTYKLIGETKGFLCLICEKISWKEIDFQNKFCSNCNLYHENTDLEVVDEENVSLDPSKLNLYDFKTETDEVIQVQVAGTLPDEITPLSKDSKTASKLNKMANTINFGIDNKILRKLR